MEDHERELLRGTEQILQHATFGIGDEEISSEMMSMAVGTGMAALDAFLAIRDGSAWRGETDPKKIAGKLLREIGFGGEAVEE